MAVTTGDRDRVAVWYAVWASVCAAAAGVAVALLDAFVLSHLEHRVAVAHTLFDEAVAILALAAGQGAVALVTASLLAQMGRALQATVLLGLLIGVFDFLFNLLQVLVPAIEVEQVWKLVISLVAAIAITAWGARAGGGATTSAE